MGKASRNKRENLELRRAEAEKKQAEAKQKKKRGLWKKILGTVATVVIVLIIAGAVIYSNLVSGGFVQRHTIAVTSENYEVDNTIMSYHFYSQYQNFMSYAGSYASSFGLDTSKSLKSQVCSLLPNNQTWYTYFMDMAKEQVEFIVMFCEEAIDRGIELDDADYDTIKETISSLKSEARANNVSVSYYISSIFGSGVKEKDIRRALEMEMLANKCRQAIVAEYSYDEADFDKYIEENPTALLHYTYAQISLSTQDGMVEGDITADILAQFKPQFEAVTNKEEFDAVAFDYLRNYAYKDYEDTTDEDIQEEIDGFLKENVVYSDSAFAKWALEHEPNDIYTSMNEDGTALDAYILIEKPALQDYSSVNVRHVLLTSATYGSDDAAKAKAEELLAQWESGAKTAESFGELANEHSEDGAENGLYENVIKGEMVEAFENWLFEDGRAVGDTGIVKSDYGYHIMYMDGFGDPAWHKEADDKLKQAQYELDLAALKEKHEITVDDYALALLDV